MWLVFLKIAEIRWDRPGLIFEKLALFTEKSVLFSEKSVQKTYSNTSDFFHSVEFLNIPFHLLPSPARSVVWSWFVPLLSELAFPRLHVKVVVKLSIYSLQLQATWPYVTRSGMYSIAGSGYSAVAGATAKRLL
jgi:hypothetical protein